MAADYLAGVCVWDISVIVFQWPFSRSVWDVSVWMYVCYKDMPTLPLHTHVGTTLFLLYISAPKFLLNLLLLERSLEYSLVFGRHFACQETSFQ